MIDMGKRMLTADPLKKWPEFMQAVRCRMEEGAKEYGERSFRRAPADLAGEIEQELLEVCGSSYILWSRLQGIRKAMGKLDPRPGNRRGERGYKRNL